MSIPNKRTFRQGVVGIAHNETPRFYCAFRRRSGCVAARGARAAQKLPTIGVLGTASALAWSTWTDAFVQRLRELGWIEGRTVAIEYRWADGRSDRFAEIAAEFVRLKVDVILTSGACGLRGKAGHLNDPDRLGDLAGPSSQRPGRQSCATGR